MKAITARWEHGQLNLDERPAGIPEGAQAVVVFVDGSVPEMIARKVREAGVAPMTLEEVSDFVHEVRRERHAEEAGALTPSPSEGEGGGEGRVREALPGHVQSGPSP